MERDAQPATIPGTEYDGRAGVLRFNFAGYGGRELEEIDWEDRFETFDERELVFVFQEHKSDGARAISSSSTIPTANARSYQGIQIKGRRGSRARLPTHSSFAGRGHECHAPIASPLLSNYPAFNSATQCAQRVALSGIVDRQ